MSVNRFFLVAFACAACAGSAHAFKLQGPGLPLVDLVPGVNRQQQAFLSQFSSDVHERITRRAYDAAGVRLPGDVMTGVRWNDNPPSVRLGALFGNCNSREMKLAEGLDCWTSMMRLDRMAWEALTRREKSIAPIRSHFGDMQFLHAMAARSGESAAETRWNVLRWSEFAYRVARGEVAPHANIFTLRASGAISPRATR